MVCFNYLRPIYILWHTKTGYDIESLKLFKSSMTWIRLFTRVITMAINLIICDQYIFRTHFLDKLAFAGAYSSARLL